MNEKGPNFNFEDIGLTKLIILVMRAIVIDLIYV